MTALTTALVSPSAPSSGVVIQDALKSHTTALLGFGILFLIVGTVAILLPVSGTLLAQSLLSGLMILSGFLYGGLSFQLRGFWNVVWTAIVGLLTITAGLILLFYPLQGILTLTLFLSAYFIVTGVFKGIHALQHRSRHGWVWSLASAIASIALGSMIGWGFPGTALWTLGLLFGIDLIIYGWALIAIRSAVKDDGLTPTVPAMSFFQYLAAGLLLVAWSVAMAIDEPPYTVVRTHDTFEVRQYEPYRVAETVVSAAAKDAGNPGFRILANYIFGGNKGERKIAMTAPVAQTPIKIAMTAPVAQSASAGGYLIQFAMPREWTLETLPEPLDSQVTLREIPPVRTVAVIRYSGTWSQHRYEKHLKTLQDALEQAGLQWHGAAQWARYDPPWIPWFLRRNEIWLDLD